MDRCGSPMVHPSPHYKQGALGRPDAQYRTATHLRRGRRRRVAAHRVRRHAHPPAARRASVVAWLLSSTASANAPTTPRRPAHQNLSRRCVRCRRRRRAGCRQVPIGRHVQWRKRTVGSGKACHGRTRHGVVAQLNAVTWRKKRVEAEDERPLLPKQIGHPLDNLGGVDGLRLELLHDVQEAVVHIGLGAKLVLNLLQVGQRIFHLQLPARTSATIGTASDIAATTAATTSSSTPSPATPTSGGGAWSNTLSAGRALQRGRQTPIALPHLPPASHPVGRIVGPYARQWRRVAARVSTCPGSGIGKTAAGAVSSTTAPPDPTADSGGAANERPPTAAVSAPTPSRGTTCTVQQPSPPARRQGHWRRQR